jgi:hypothetical protein
LLLFAQEELSRMEIERTEILSPRFAFQRIASDTASSVSSEPVEMTASVPLQRIRDLEDSLSFAKAAAAQQAVEVERLMASASDKTSEIEDLSKAQIELKDILSASERALRESDNAHREKDDTISSLESRVHFLSRESADRRGRIDLDLVPALEAAKSDIRLKASENSALVMENAELRVTANKTKSLLEHEIATSLATGGGTRFVLGHGMFTLKARGRPPGQSY